MLRYLRVQTLKIIIYVGEGASLFLIRNRLNILGKSPTYTIVHGQDAIPTLVNVVIDRQRLCCDVVVHSLADRWRTKKTN